MSQAMRLSSVWPIYFQYHSQATATGSSCAGYVKMAPNFTVRQQFKHLKSLRSGVWIELANKIRVGVS